MSVTGTEGGWIIAQTPVTIEEIPLGDARLKDFVDMPWHLYKNDPCWTPPLKADLLGNKRLGLVGLLRLEHPYHRHAEVTHFLARRGKKPVGRITAAINHRFNEHYKTRLGFFGFMEFVKDYRVAETLLDRARQWIRERGMTVMRGPGEYSNATHERQGILVKGFEHPPTVDLTHNPPYYARFLERYGFRKVKDYHAHTIDVQTPTPPRLRRLAERVRRRRDIQTRPLEMANLLSDVHLIVEIYNDAWSQNWGFLPITDAEAAAMAESLRLVADPGLVRFAFVGGEPVGVLGAFPDPHYAIRPRRLMFFGVRPGFRRLGIDAVLFEEVKGHAMRRGYKKCEASMLLEDNHLILSPSEFMGARRYKTWRIYDLPLV